MLDKISKICEKILEVNPKYSNGGFIISCPFCDALHERDQYLSMSDLNHSKDCLYILAKEILSDKIFIRNKKLIDILKIIK